MKRLLLMVLTAIMAAASLTAQTTQHHVVNVGDFTHLRVVNAINVDYKSSTDSAGMAVFDAPVELVNAIIFSNNNKGKLSIEVDIMSVINRTVPNVTVYSRYLNHIENVADSTVRAFNVKAGPKFKARLEGNGRLSLRDIDAGEINATVFTGRGQLAISGRCDKASLSGSGPCTIQADRLEAARVSASLTGPCTIGCNARDELSVSGLLGKGTVYYRGNPKIKNRTIGVKTVPIEEPEQ